MLGLACVGLAVTAGTYASIGIATPARAGLTLVKDARRAGRLSAGLGEWAGKSVTALVDKPLLERAIADASLLQDTATERRMVEQCALAGAGDGAVAGFCQALLRNAAPPEQLEVAVRVASAVCLTPGTAEFHAEDLARLPPVQVRRWE